MTISPGSSVEKHLGDRAEFLLGFDAPKIPKKIFAITRTRLSERVFAASGRNNRALVNLQRILGQGRLRNTGYVSLLPVDQQARWRHGFDFRAQGISTLFT